MKEKREGGGQRARKETEVHLLSQVCVCARHATHHARRWQKQEIPLPLALALTNASEKQTEKELTLARFFANDKKTSQPPLLASSPTRHASVSRQRSWVIKWVGWGAALNRKSRTKATQKA
jgi:hypothetical protein